MLFQLGSEGPVPTLGVTSIHADVIYGSHALSAFFTSFLNHVCGPIYYKGKSNVKGPGSPQACMDPATASLS